MENIKLSLSSRAWALVGAKQLLKETFARRNVVYPSLRPMVIQQVRELVQTVRELKGFSAK